MMTLEEMGALLRQERERQGISLETAATEIKISKKYLIALEDGQTKELPHPVYAKGFVKNYARLLGLDPEEMGTTLSNHYAVDDDQLREPPGQDLRESAPSIKERRPSFAPQGPGFKPSLWLALPLLLVFGGLVWFFFFSSFGKGFSVESVLGLFSSKQEQSAPAPQAQDAQKPAAPVQQAKPAPASSASGPKAEAKPEPVAPALADQNGPVQRDLLATTPGPGGVKQTPAVAPAPASEQDITPEKLAAEAQFAASGKQVVEINATQPATLEVTAEDGQKRSLTLIKGQRLALRFNDKVAVRFQQAPAVSVKLNGKDYPLEGGRGDGKNITFP